MVGRFLDRSGKKFDWTASDLAIVPHQRDPPLSDYAHEKHGICFVDGEAQDLVETRVPVRPPIASEVGLLSTVYIA